jgi:hypothetical protein
MLHSLILYVVAIWTTFLALVARVNQRLLSLRPAKRVQAPELGHGQIIKAEADASPALSSTTLTSTTDDKEEHEKDKARTMPAAAVAAAAAPVGASKAPAYPGGIKAYYQAKIEATELTINERTQNLRRLEAQRNALNARGTYLRKWRRVRNRLTRLGVDSALAEGGTAASYGAWELCWRGRQGYGQDKGPRQGAARGEIQ